MLRFKFYLTRKIQKVPLDRCYIIQKCTNLQYTYLAGYLSGIKTLFGGFTAIILCDQQLSARKYIL